MTSYFLGLDNGGTVTKAALFDETGRQVAVSSAPTRIIQPAPGFVERDMEEMYITNCRVIQDVLKKSAVDPADVRAVSISGHGKGLYLWGKDNRPAYHGIVSTDDRAVDYLIQWKKDGSARAFRQWTCQDLMSCSPLALLAWIRDHEPAVYGNIGIIFCCKDYLRFRLTGEVHAELTDYSGSDFVNLYTGTYDPRIFECFGLSDVYDALPPLCKSLDVVGHITPEASEKCGLPVGCPVIGGLFDITACALATGVIDETKLCMITGTWSINEYPKNSPCSDESEVMNSFFCLDGMYLVNESSPTSSGNSHWVNECLFPDIKKAYGSEFHTVIDQWIEEVGLEEPCPVFLPFLFGSNAHPKAMSSFVGLRSFHDRRHMARSVYEGIVFCHRVHFERLMRTRDTMPECIRLAGGAAKSSVLVQMFADVMKLPVEVVEVEETGAAGCAIAAMTAMGVYPSMEAAVANCVRVKARVLPNPAASAAYEKKFSRYQKTVEALDSLWDLWE